MFDVPALIMEAVKASNASGCVKFRKLAEGTSNRVFELELDNGSQLIAKIPFPIAGPAHFTTASEVATMRYARDILQLPVPKVLAWCSRAENTPVKSEYIIMEKVHGGQLYDTWDKLDNKSLFHIMLEITKVEKRMANDEFSVLGSLYFERDLPLGTVKTPLRLVNENGATIDHDGYCIGPSVSRRFWRGERAHMKIDRGPWASYAEYAQAVIACEIEWLRSHAKSHPKDSPLFRSDKENDPLTHIRLLEKYALVASSLTPREDLCAFRLWHPDLHLSNILISGPKSPEIAGIIDWQESCIDLLLSSGSVPQFMAYSGGKYVPEPSPPGEAAPTPVLPEQFNDLDDSEKRKAEEELKAAKRYWVYTLFTEKQNPTLHRHRLRLDGELALCTWPLYWASRTWDEGLAFFENCLIMICDSWDSINPDKPCPISFTAEERRENERLLTTWMREQELEQLSSEIGVQPDGVVGFSDLEEARRRNLAVMERIVSALPEREREDARRRWPFQDGALSLTAEACR